MGKKHKSKFKEGDRINDRFTLMYNHSVVTTNPIKPTWLWHCKCDCGNEFDCRERTLLNRFGCQNCTNIKTSTETALRKHNGVEHIGLKNRLLKDYRTGAVRRGLSFNLDFETFITLLEQPCYYCGAEPKLHEYELQYMQKYISPWKHNGIDRLDTKRGYEKDNVVSCCSICNYAKHDLSVEDFKEWIKRVYSNMFLCSSTIPKGSTPQVNGGGNGESPTDFIKFPQFSVRRNDNQGE